MSAADDVSQTASTQLTLSAVKSPAGFTFPPIYSFPAFFTRQPNATTFASQSRQWQSLILSFCQFHRIFRIDLADSALLREVGPGSESAELWSNKRIARRARPDFIQELIHIMVKAGSAIYDPPFSGSKLASSSPPILPRGTGAFILWRSIEDWAQVIYHWVAESGQTNAILTMYELQEPGSTKDFADLPASFLRQVLQALVKQNKAQIFQASQAGDGEGVKFF